MTRSRTVLSGLIVFHLLAIGVSAIPPPSELISGEFPHASPDDTVAEWVAPALDGAARWLAPAERWLYTLSRPLAAVTAPYVNAGLRQRWDMFARPQTDNHYVRLGYYVRSPRAEPRVALDLVFPAQPDDRVRLVHDYQDKAVIAAFEAFFRAGVDHRAPHAGTARQLQPLIRHFGNEFRRAHLAQDESIVRTDVWYGSAPMPQRRETTSGAVLGARIDVLRNYYDGPVPPVIRHTQPPRLFDEEREGDIVWILAAIDEH